MIYVKYIGKIIQINILLNRLLELSYCISFFDRRKLIINLQVFFFEGQKVTGLKMIFFLSPFFKSPPTFPLG